MSRSARHLGIEISRRHRTAAGLAQTPGDAGIVLGDFLDDRDVGRGRQFGAAERTGQQQAEQSTLDQRLDDRFGQVAAPLDFLGRRLEFGTKFLRAPEVVVIGRLGILQITGGRVHHPLLIDSMADPPPANINSRFR